MIYAVYVAKNKIEYSWYSENDFQTQSDFLKKKEFADNFVSFVVNIEDVKNQFIHAIRCNENAHENAKKYLEKLLDFLNLKGVIIEKLYVFTHWGNGNDPETVSKEEEQIRNEIENCKDIIGPDSDYEIDNLKQLSLSSLRSEVLAVGAPRIKVPETLYELECLVNDLENIGDKKKEEIMGSAQKQLNKRLRNIKRPRSTKPRKMRIVLIDFSNTETLSEEIRPIKLLERALNDGVSKELNLQFKIKNLDAESLNWSDALPIWIVPSIKRLQKDSFAIPREFVVETLRPYISSREMEQTNVNPEADIESPRLVDRLEQLVMQFQNDDCKTINLRDYMRDWSVGTFRKYCFLDEHVHGSSGLLNIKGLTSEKWEKVADDIIKKWLSKDEYLPELMTVRTLEDALNLDDEIRPALLEIQNSTKGKSDKNKDAGIICKKRYQEINDNRKMFRGRFGEIETNADPLHKYKSLFQILFIEEFERIKNLIEESPTPEKVKKVFSEFDVLEPSENASIPKECGISIRHTSPILKFRVLVIDDKAEEECERLSGLPALKEIFNFFPMPLRGDNIIDSFRQSFFCLFQGHLHIFLVVCHRNQSKRVGDSAYCFAIISEKTMRLTKSDF